jgi:(-)-germacrene D synthase
MKERARLKEEEVRQIVRDTFASSSDMDLKLELVDTLQRIGVAYRYGEEIDELLRAVHRDAQHQEGGRDDELYVTSLRFYLLREHGYSVSSGNYSKFLN